jgi:hypothetical protein
VYGSLLANYRVASNLPEVDVILEVLDHMDLRYGGIEHDLECLGMQGDAVRRFRQKMHAPESPGGRLRQLDD